MKQLSDEKVRKGFKVRMIISAAAVVAAGIAVLIANGVIGYLFTGKDAFLNDRLYSRKTYVYYKEYEITSSLKVEEKDFSFTAAVNENALTLTIDIEFDYSLGGGKIVSVKPFGMEKENYVAHVKNGDDECELLSLDYKEKHAVAVYSLNAPVGKITVNNFVISEFTKK